MIFLLANFLILFLLFSLPLHFIGGNFVLKVLTVY